MKGFKLRDTPESHDYHYLDRNTGSTALMYAACFCENTEIIDKLIKCNAQIDAEDSRGGTAIFWSISSSNIDVLKRLLDNKAKINFFSKAGISPLVFALSSKILCTRQIIY